MRGKLLLICPTSQANYLRHFGTTGKSLAAREIVSRPYRYSGTRVVDPGSAAHHAAVAARRAASGESRAIVGALRDALHLTPRLFGLVGSTRLPRCRGAHASAGSSPSRVLVFGSKLRRCACVCQ